MYKNYNNIQSLMDEYLSADRERKFEIAQSLKRLTEPFGFDVTPNENKDGSTATVIYFLKIINSVSKSITNNGWLDMTEVSRLLKDNRLYPTINMEMVNSWLFNGATEIYNKLHTQDLGVIDLSDYQLKGRESVYEEVYGEDILSSCPTYLTINGIKYKVDGSINLDSLRYYGTHTKFKAKTYLYLDKLVVELIPVSKLVKELLTNKDERLAIYDKIFNTLRPVEYTEPAEHDIWNVIWERLSRYDEIIDPYGVEIIKPINNDGYINPYSGLVYPMLTVAPMEVIDDVRQCIVFEHSDDNPWLVLDKVLDLTEVTYPLDTYDLSDVLGFYNKHTQKLYINHRLPLMSYVNRYVRYIEVLDSLEDVHLTDVGKKYIWDRLSYKPIPVINVSSTVNPLAVYDPTVHLDKSTRDILTLDLRWSDKVRLKMGDTLLISDVTGYKVAHIDTIIALNKVKNKYHIVVG